MAVGKSRIERGYSESQGLISEMLKEVEGYMKEESAKEKRGFKYAGSPDAEVV